MQERVAEIEFIYIQNTSGKNYSVECVGRQKKTTKLNFTDVEGIEINTRRPLEVTNSFLQMSDMDNKIWNMRFAFPTELIIKFIGKILIEVQ